MTEVVADLQDVVESAALEYARSNAIVLPGDTVITTWGGQWKKPHKVVVVRVGAALASSYIRHRDPPFVAQFEMEYIGLRLDKNGAPPQNQAGLVLREFETETGQTWKQTKETINHQAYSWELPESWKYVTGKGYVDPHGTR